MCPLQQCFGEAVCAQLFSVPRREGHGWAQGARAKGNESSQGTGLMESTQMWPDTGRGPIRGGQEGPVFRERKSNCWGHLGTIQKHCGFRNPRAGAHALHQLTCTLLGRVPSKGCAELSPTATPAVSPPAVATSHSRQREACLGTARELSASRHVPFFASLPLPPGPCPLPSRRISQGLGGGPPCKKANHHPKEYGGDSTEGGGTAFTVQLRKDPGWAGNTEKRKKSERLRKKEQI